MLAAIAVALTGFTLPAAASFSHASPTLRARTYLSSAAMMVEPGQAWSEWSLQQVGVLDGAVLALVSGGVYALTTRGSDEEQDLSSQDTQEPSEIFRDPNELPGLFEKKRGGTPKMMAEAESRSRRLNKQAYNRRNMSIDERQAFDELMAKREKDGASRNAILAVVAIVAGGAFVASGGAANFL